MKTVGYIATSLDGYIARDNHALDWLESPEWEDPDGSDYGFQDFLSSIDAILIGKNTFLKVAEIGVWVYRDIPFCVVSKTLKNEEIPENLKEKVTVISGSPQELMDMLNDKKYSRVYVDGGKLLQSFIESNHLNELIITRIPILLGGGISLFGALPTDRKVKHVDTKCFKSGLTRSQYYF